MDIIGAFLVYAGLIAAFVAGISVIKPIHFLGFRRRLRAFAFAGLGLAASLLGMLLPAYESRPAALRTRLDEFAPVYQFQERHTVRVHASREQCYAAIRNVGPEEIALFRTLTWLRRFGKRGAESIINAPQHQPLLETAIRTGFLPLAEDRDREVVIGAVMGRPTPERARAQRSAEQFKSLTAPDEAKIAMNFLVEPTGPDECRVITETRVYATSAAGRRAFAAYWRVIYPGSALIRRMWLRAIQRRAEAEARSL
jgi:hypothetical protein